MRIALVVNPVTSSRESNLDTVVDMIHEAAAHGADIVLLGEMAVTGMVNNDDPGHDRQCAESVPGPLTNLLAETAMKLGIWLGIGILEIDGARIYDTALLFSPSGAIRLKYRRIQPQWRGGNADPTVYSEGTEIPVVETDFGSVVFLVCGDLWDDDLRRRVRDVRPDMVLHPFARCFEDGSRDQVRWETNELPEYQSRVAEIGAPLFGASYLSAGVVADEAVTYGGAMVIDRNGQVLAAHPLDCAGILYFVSS